MTKGIAPMGLGLSLMAFGVPAAAFTAGIWLVQPQLVTRGMPPFQAQCVVTGPLFLGMIAGAVILGRREAGGHSVWRRLRLRRLDRVQWGVGILAFLVSLVGLAVGSVLIQPLFGNGTIPIPAFVPDLIRPLPGDGFWEALDTRFGGLRGNWSLFGLYLGLLILNVVGEELWWRGYILPRQVARFRGRTWIIHGTMWACFHVFIFWEIPTLLPMTLALSYLACRSGNTNVGIVVHGLYNGTALIPLTMLVVRGIGGP